MSTAAAKQRPRIIVPGFYFAGVSAGIKNDPRKKDLALIYSEVPQTAIAGVFTKNTVCAAPVKICRKHLQGKTGRLIVVNSGNANAATGPDGMKRAMAVMHFAAKTFALKEREVFVCSTGKIGVTLPIKKVTRGILAAKSRLHAEGLHNAALAICTTDAYPKTAVFSGKLTGKPFTIAVIAKGAGMICPNMATLLSFVVTDLAIPQLVLQLLLKSAVSESLNCLTVDGDTSTNDTVLMLANGRAKNAPIKKNSAGYHQVQKILTQLLHDIAVKIALDGEGATKCFITCVTGAKNAREAQAIAMAIGNSNLVKAAMFGGDPNWGRILCAAGYSGAKVFESDAKVAIGGKTVFDRGVINSKNLNAVAKYLRANRLIDVAINVGRGRGVGKSIASDLTYDYVKLNAEYHT